MSGSIYAIQGDEQLVEMLERPYESEALLQGFLEKYHSLLAGDQMDTRQPRRWVLVKREAQLPSEEEGAARWSVDHLFLDQDAIPTIVEVKRSSDTRIRREVVGQMLDYAANAVVYWPVERVRAMFEAQHGEVADQVLGALLSTPDGVDAEQFWQKVKTNLQAGKVRLVFIADYISPELRRIVEFLNQQMDPAEVLAVEIRQYVGQGLRTLVPRVIGQTAQAQQKKGTSSSEGGHWDQTRFMQVLAESKGQNISEVAARILEWGERKGLRFWWGQGIQYGSFFPLLDHNGKSYWTVSVWTYGSIEVQFQMMKTMPPFDDESRRKQLLGMLNAIPGVNMPEDAITRRPSIKLTTLEDGVAYEQFEAALDWVLEQYMAS